MLMRAAQWQNLHKLSLWFSGRTNTSWPGKSCPDPSVPCWEGGCAQDVWLIFKLRYGQMCTWAMASGAYRLQLFWFLASWTPVVIDVNFVMGVNSWADLSFLLTTVNAFFFPFIIIYSYTKCSESARYYLKNKNSDAVITLGHMKTLYHSLQTRNSMSGFPFWSML